MRFFLSVIMVTLFSVTTFAADKDLNSKLPVVTSLEVDGDVLITLVDGDEDRIEGVIPGNQVDNFTWSVVDGTTLMIKLKKPLNLDGRNVISPVKLTIYVSDLQNIECKRGTSIIADKPIESKGMNITLSKSALVSIPIKCNDLTIDASTSSILTLTGQVQSAVVQCSSASTVNNRGLVTENTTVKASTDSECYVAATKKLMLTAKTKGHIFYKKSDAVVTESISLLGQISQYE